MIKVLWTKDRDARLMEMFDQQRISMELIGLELGCTRNAIAGRIKRLREKGNLLEAGYKRRQPLKRLDRHKHVVERASTVVKFFADDDEGVQYLENRGCKAILDKRGDMGLSMCCGKQFGKDLLGRTSPYCEQHLKKFAPTLHGVRYG